MAPPVTWSVRARGRARRRLLRGRGWVWARGSGEEETVVRGRGWIRTPGVGGGRDRRPASRLSPSPGGRARQRPLSGVEVESEPWGRARRSPSSEVEVESEPRGSGEAETGARGRGWVRALGSGEAESVVWGRGWVRALGSSEAELPMAPEVGLGGCQPHPDGWHSSRSSTGGTVFLSGRSVEWRSDCGHFGSVDWGARVRIRCQSILALNAPAIRSVGVAIRPWLLLREACSSWVSGESKVRPLLEGTLGRDVNSPGSAAFARG
jgi:hypothetical protein